MAGTKYKRLAEYLRREFIDGKPAMSPLPSIPTLMSNQGVSQATVDRALGVLEKEGLVRRMPGVGCFSAPGTPPPTQRDPLNHEIFQSGRVKLPCLRVAVVRMPQGKSTMWEALAKGMAEAHPRIKVELIYHDVSRDSTLALLNAEDPVDILYSPPSHLDWLEHSELLAGRPHPTALSALAPEQQHFLVPYSFTARTVLYLKRQMDELGLDFSAGWSTTDFMDCCRKLRSRVPDGRPFLVLDDYLNFFGRQGLSLIETDPWRVQFQSERVGEALAELAELATMKAFPLCSRVGLSEVVNLLSAGHPAMCIGRMPWQARLEGMGVPPLGMWPVPLDEGGYQATAVNYLSVYRYSRFPDLAWEFIDYVCGPRGQEIIDSSLMEFPLYETQSGRLHHPDFLRGLRQTPGLAEPAHASLDQEIHELFMTSVFNPEIEAYLLGEHTADECQERISRMGTALIRNTLAHRERISPEQGQS